MILHAMKKKACLDSGLEAIFFLRLQIFILYIYMESPSNAEALCFPFFDTNEGFLCRINIVSYPLTDKNVILSKKEPFSL